MDKDVREGDTLYHNYIPYIHMINITIYTMYTYIP